MPQQRETKAKRQTSPRVHILIARKSRLTRQKENLPPYTEERAGPSLSTPRDDLSEHIDYTVDLLGFTEDNENIRKPEILAFAKDLALLGVHLNC